MSNNTITSSIFVRFRLLTWLGAFFCFAVVPVFLIDAGLSSILQLRHEKELRHIFNEMDDRLNFMTRYADEPHFYHSLLKAAFDEATHHEKWPQTILNGITRITFSFYEAVSNARLPAATKSDGLFSHQTIFSELLRSCRRPPPLTSMARNIKRLKQRFPGALRFIVWDEKGKVVDSLNDEKNYRYIVNNLFFFFREIAEHCRDNYPGEPQQLPIVEKRFNLFRSYLGRFLVPNHLRLPFQAGEHGRCILADSQNGFPLFWFDSKPGLTIFCAIKTSHLTNAGIRYAITAPIKNGSGAPISSGFIDMRNLDDKIAEADSPFKRLLLLELAKYENAGLPHRNTDNFLMAFKLLSPDLRGYCVVNRRDMAIGYPEQYKARILFRAAGFIIVLLFVCYCYSLRQPKRNFSIRLRIAFLFLYANGLPLMILGTTGYEYLQQQEDTLLSEAHSNSERILQEIDSGYERHKRTMNRETIAELAQYTEETTSRLPGRQDLERLKQIVHRLKGEEINIYDTNGNNLVEYRRVGKSAGQTFIRVFAANSLNFSNQTESDTEAADALKDQPSVRITKDAIIMNHSSILENMLNLLDSVNLYSFGTDLKLCFARLLGNRQQRNFHSFLILTWRVDDAQSSYAEQQISRTNTGGSETEYVAMSTTTGQIFAKSGVDEEKLRPILQKAMNLRSAHADYIELNGRNSLVTAIAGRQMDKMVLAAITSTAPIIKKLETTWYQMFAIVIFSLMIISAVVVALSRQFIGPVRQLSETVRQISKRNFSHRTQIESDDEFGQLGQTFNETMADMAELEIGRVVQEALLPEASHKSDRIEIFAKTATMTKLGGDYFDYLKLPDNQTGVFMGDVAGHGIPAALIMAMAKATVTIQRKFLTDPAMLLSSLHDMLFKLKSDGFKRMMTCQYLVINDKSGKVSFANAGHCFPVIVGKNGKAAHMLEIIGTPVGIARKARYQNHLFELQPGETVILYSDGMLEATSTSGEVFGPDNLLNLAKSAWHKDLSQYYQNLFQANRAWAQSVDDDLTIVLLRLSGGRNR